MRKKMNINGKKKLGVQMEFVRFRKRLGFTRFSASL